MAGFRRTLATTGQSKMASTAAWAVSSVVSGSNIAGIEDCLIERQLNKNDYQGECRFWLDFVLFGGLGLENGTVADIRKKCEVENDAGRIKSYCSTDFGIVF